MFMYHKEYESDRVKLKLHRSVMDVLRNEITDERLLEELELDMDEQIAGLSKNGVLVLPLLHPYAINQIIKQLNYRHYWVTSTVPTERGLWLTYHFE